LKSIKPHGKRKIVSLDEAMRRAKDYTPKKKEEMPEPVSSEHISDFVELNDLKCVASSGQVIEEYPVLAVAGDIERYADSNHSMVKSGVSVANVQLKKHKKGFLPSLALTCNIVVKLYENRDLPSMQELLCQYKLRHFGDEWGVTLQNTLVNHHSYKIAHYPTMINEKDKSPARTELFTADLSTRYESVSLETITLDPLLEKFVKDLTGLEDPTVLIKIADYFDADASILFPTDREYDPTRMCRFGCIRNELVIDTQFRAEEAYRRVSL